jgi:transcriptional regulator PpsR
MTAFKRASHSFSGLPVEVCSQLIALASDVSLVLSRDGAITDVAISTDELPSELAHAWLDRPLADIVPADEHHKLTDLLACAERPGFPRWRQMNLTGHAGVLWPMQCLAVTMETDGRMLLVGRSLQASAKLQQRLVHAQQTMEQDYWQFRDAETRYRQLFQSCAEGVLVLDAETFRVLEVNPAACRLLDHDEERSLIGRSLPEHFGADVDAVRLHLTRVRASGRPADLPVSAGHDHAGLLLSASVYRQSGSAHLLVRLARRQADTSVSQEVSLGWADLVRVTPDAMLLTDGEGRIQAANGAFLELAQLGAEEQLVGESLDRWLDRSGVDLSVLLSNLLQRGVVRLYATRLRGELGSSIDVEIAAVEVADSPPRLGFTVRDVSRRLGSAPRGLQALPKSVAQLTELVGRVPMKDIVGETAELIEQLCIEAALELTRGNRASAAEMLGMSRQSLYVKLRRYGLKDLDVENEK